MDGGWTKSDVEGRTRGRSDAARLLLGGPGLAGIGMGCALGGLPR